MKSFSFARIPALHFGRGRFETIIPLLQEKQTERIVLVTGGTSFRESERWQQLQNGLKDAGIDAFDYRVHGEPTPDLVDGITAEVKKKSPQAVLAIGGGSVIDTGKAVSAMLKSSGSVQDYLEGVGTKQPPGEKVFMIAVPTTSGTGSEATKNAVICRHGEGGFKKSLRHDNYIPDAAVIDGELMLSCPRSITAASGLDAITQLLEAYVSTEATPLTDSLALNGLAAAGRSFEQAVVNGESAIDARELMAYAACISGIVLANAGLGIVHGIAGHLGSMSAIPHGTVCGTLVGAATEVIIDRLFDMELEDNIPLLKYGEAGKYLSGRDGGTVEDNCGLLIDQLTIWIEKFEIPRLGIFNILPEDIGEIVEKSGLKNTPVPLSPEDIETIITARL